MQKAKKINVKLGDVIAVLRVITDLGRLDAGDRSALDTGNTFGDCFENVVGESVGC